MLRAFEQLAGVNAVRPDIAGNMGAYGAALLARDRYQAAVRTAERAGKTADVHTAMLGAAALEALGPHAQNRALQGLREPLPAYRERLRQR